MLDSGTEPAAQPARHRQHEAPLGSAQQLWRQEICDGIDQHLLEPRAADAHVRRYRHELLGEGPIEKRRPSLDRVCHGEPVRHVQEFVGKLDLKINEPHPVADRGRP